MNWIDAVEGAMPFVGWVGAQALDNTPWGMAVTAGLTFGIDLWVRHDSFADSAGDAALSAVATRFLGPSDDLKMLTLLRLGGKWGTSGLLDAGVGWLSDPGNPLNRMFGGGGGGGGPAEDVTPAPAYLVDLHTGGCPEDSSGSATTNPQGMYPVYAPPVLAVKSGKSNYGVSPTVYQQFLQLRQMFCSSWKQLGEPGTATTPPSLTSSGTIESAMDELWTQVVSIQSQAPGLANYGDLVSAFSSDFHTLASDYTAVNNLLKPPSNAKSGSTASGPLSSSLSSSYSSQLTGCLVTAKIAINSALVQMQNTLKEPPMATITPPNGSTYEDVNALNQLETALSALHTAFSTLNGSLNQLDLSIQGVIQDTPKAPPAPPPVPKNPPPLKVLPKKALPNVPNPAVPPVPQTGQGASGASGPSGASGVPGSDGSGPTTPATLADQAQQQQNQLAQQEAQQQAQMQQQEAQQQAQMQQQEQQQEEQQMVEEMMQQLSSSAMQMQNQRALQEPQALTPAPPPVVPQATATPPPVEAIPTPPGPAGPAGPVGGSPDTGAAGAAHPGAAQRTPGADGSIVYTFPDGRTQKVSPAVAKALDAAFSNAAGTDARAAYSSGPVTWQEQRNPGTRVDPNKLMTGDVCKWDKDKSGEHRTALVVAFGPDSGGPPEVIVGGQMLQFAADMHDAHGALAQFAGFQFAGFFHPAGIEISATSTPDAGSIPAPGMGSMLDPGSTPTLQVTPAP